jgi:hypothetical protein
MNISNAVRQRVQTLCAENGVTLDESVVCAEIFRALEDEGDVPILLVKRLCDALGMTLRDFFADPLFAM